jgi:hypothetical protein
MIFGQVGEHRLAALRDAQPNRAAILRAAIAHDEARFDETIHELDNRVMTNTQLRRQRTHGRLDARWQPANGQQELMLTRLDADLPCRRFRERTEPPQLVTEGRQRSVVSIREREPGHRHAYIASRYIRLVVNPALLQIRTVAADHRVCKRAYTA